MKKYSLILLATFALPACNQGSSSAPFGSDSGPKTFEVLLKGEHLDITPDTDQRVILGSTQTFEVLADSGYSVSDDVGGSCPQGSWSGSDYTTGVIEDDCFVEFFAIPDVHSVTVSGDHSVPSPATAQNVDHDDRLSYTVTADTGYFVISAVGGTCAVGSWAGSVYTTGPIVEDCTISFSALPNTRTISVSSTNSSSVPATSQTVTYGSNSSFTVTPDSGYGLSASVGGDCPTGIWVGNIYTTGIITSDCSVSFSATRNVFTVTPNLTNVTSSPNTPQSVNSGDTRAFTVTALTGYTTLSSVGGTCPAGSWVGTTYTTGAITTDCSVNFSASLNTYSVTPSLTNVTTSPVGAQTVNHGSTQAFTVTADTGYTRSSSVGGTCAAGSWVGSVYTTGVITANCTVSFSATINTHTVTPSGTNVTLSPSSAQTINYGSTQAFIVTADTGYTNSASVGGTCAAGSWVGTTYTTGAVTADCTVTFSATLNSYSVTPSVSHVSTSPVGAQTVNHGSTQAFTVTADTGYTLSSTVGGTCAAGSWVGAVYTTGTITGNCTVSFSGTINSYTVTPSGSHATSSPATAQSVNYGGTQSFTLTPDANYFVISSVGGTCPSGSWAGNVYTTGAIVANCTVSFTALLDTRIVTPSFSNVTSVPSSAQIVSVNTTQSFTITPATGYTTDAAVGGTCPSGSWVGSVYTTGTIVADCTVSFSATLNTYSVTPSVTGVTTSPLGVQTVNHGSTQMFTVTADSGYTLSSTVGGTCPAGSWVGADYTTGTIVANCTISFSGDVILPTAGAGPTFASVTTSGLTLNWAAGSDTVDSVANLSYRVVKATASTSIDSISEVNAISGADLIMDWTTATLTTPVTGLSAGEFAYYTVAVRNLRNGVALYSIRARAAGPMIYVSTGSTTANLGGIAGADTLCDTDKVVTADLSATLSAVLSDGTTRVACSSADCTSLGAAENVGWPIQASTTYYNVNGSAIGSSTAEGIFTFPFTAAVTSTGLTAWTGINADWTPQAENCSSWVDDASAAALNLGMANSTSNTFLDGSASACNSASGTRLICVEH